MFKFFVLKFYTLVDIAIFVQQRKQKWPNPKSEKKDAPCSKACSITKRPRKK